MNLLTDSWMPIERRDGEVETISPLDILTDNSENPFIRPFTVRPDFDGAITQFLIGLYQILLSPEDEDEWYELLHHPPSRESLQDKISLLMPAFSFDGPDGRFMQDKSVENTDYWDIQNLILDINNTLFLKDGTIRHMCPRCAALSLLTLQLNSPSGGRGHMTSIRGGGGLTTILSLQGNEATLWTQIVLNILPQDKIPNGGYEEIDSENISKIFPWVGTMPNSETGNITVPDDLHPYHVYWNVPRRVYIDFSAKSSGKCDLCGEVSDSLISHYWSRPNGIKYQSWRHPFSPYYLAKASNEWLPTHAHDSEISYNNWLGIVFQSFEGNKEPAAVVREIPPMLYGNEEYSNLKIHVFGYITDNAKAKAWQEGILPSICVSEKLKLRFTEEVTYFINTATLVAKSLVIRIKEGMSCDSNNDFGIIKSTFWHDSEYLFYGVLKQLPMVLESDDIEQKLIDLKKEWLTNLFAVCMTIFSNWVSYPIFGEISPELCAKSKIGLRSDVSIYNQKICKTLNLPLPPKQTKSKVKK